jgi:predicted alpha/beta hydrolase family esterase
MHWTVAVIAVLVTDMLAVSVLPSVIAHQLAGLYWAAAAARHQNRLSGAASVAGFSTENNPDPKA